MSVGMEIDRQTCDYLENFKMPTKVFLGRNKYKEVLKEYGQNKMRMISHINTQAGPLQVIIDKGDPDAVHVCVDELEIVLKKLGVIS